VRAIILAAGRGLRLQQPDKEDFPKVLLNFAGQTLLERHLRLLRGAGIREIVLALGFRHETVTAQLAGLRGLPNPEIVLNPDFALGSVLTLHAASAALTRGGPVLVMDADVLYNEPIMNALVAGDPSKSRILIDRDFEAGEEPVKVCIKDGLPIELRKKVAPELGYDLIGESVGFFRFSESGARQLAAIIYGYAENNRGNQPHEEAVRDLVHAAPNTFEIADITGSPWIEIDFPADVERATREVVPRL
jgi:choline kinase